MFNQAKEELEGLTDLVRIAALIFVWLNICSLASLGLMWMFMFFVYECEFTLLFDVCPRLRVRRACHKFPHKKTLRNQRE